LGDPLDVLETAAVGRVVEGGGVALPSKGLLQRYVGGRRPPTSWILEKGLCPSSWPRGRELIGVHAGGNTVSQFHHAGTRAGGRLMVGQFGHRTHMNVVDEGAVGSETLDGRFFCAVPGWGMIRPQHLVRSGDQRPFRAGPSPAKGRSRSARGRGRGGTRQFLHGCEVKGRRNREYQEEFFLKNRFLLLMGRNRKWAVAKPVVPPPGPDRSAVHAVRLKRGGEGPPLQQGRCRRVRATC